MDLIILYVIPSCITDRKNANLIDLVSMKEFKKALFTLGGIKAPRLDGFPTLFFHKIWDIIG